MVFCCIAIVGMAIIYWVFLTLRQLFSGPRRDASSSLRAPPRAIAGQAAQPVFGHTRLFTRLGGDIALKFSPDAREWSFWLPQMCSRQIGDCFSIFIWGRWRCVIKGQDRCQRILDSSGLKEDWAWSPPISLLGKACLLQGDEEEFLHSMLSVPLAHRNVVGSGPKFGKVAEKFVEELLSGKFASTNKDLGSTNITSPDASFSDYDMGGAHGSRHSLFKSSNSTFKIKWKHLRSYTADIVMGPVLAMQEQLSSESSSDNKKTLKREGPVEDDNTQKEDGKSDEEAEVARLKRRSNMILWMNRLKKALCVIKITFGPEWMYVWLLNEYGRAVNARMHLEKVLAAHVSSKVQEHTVQRVPGRPFRDPLVMPIPILAMAENVWYWNENVVGGEGAPRARPRSRSEGFLSVPFTAPSSTASDMNPQGGDGGNGSEDSCGDAEINVVAPRRISSYAPPTVGEKRRDSITNQTKRTRSNSSPNILHTVSDKGLDDKSKKAMATKAKKKKNPCSILDKILKQEDFHGSGLTEAVTVEVSILLWMMMDAGNAWTAMALNLLSLDQNALHRVQVELDGLVEAFGPDDIYEQEALEQMKVLDAVIYEAIRLCPSFLGGMKKTSQTVELPDVNLQIPKDTHVIFCQPSETPFDISKAMGSKPEELGHLYPSPELHGFLPLKGLEVPLMVLQTKVLMIALLKSCSPYLTRKRTIIRRIKDRLAHEKVEGTDVVVDEEHAEVSSMPRFAKSSHASNVTVAASGMDDDDDDYDDKSTMGPVTQTECMELFDKIPFPEPRRVLNVRPRNSPLDVLTSTDFAV